MRRTRQTMLGVLLLLGAALAGCKSWVPPRDDAWEGIPAKVLESEEMKAVFLPSQGAALVSILDKRNGQEWCWQAPELRKAACDEADKYVMRGGLEDMFPTVGACRITEGSWEGTRAPDHGEVWRRPWQVESLQDGLRFNIQGEVFPYELVRTCRLAGSELELAYTVTNTGKEAFPFLYAAHPIFSVRGKMRILLSSGSRVVVQGSKGERLGKKGDIFPWPDVVAAEGEYLDASLVDDEQTDKTDKLFASNIREREVGLTDVDGGRRLVIKLNSSRLTSVGVWINMKAYPAGKPVSVVGLEPTTSPAETLTQAMADGTAIELQPGQSLSWSYSIVLR